MSLILKSTNFVFVLVQCQLNSAGCLLLYILYTQQMGRVHSMLLFNKTGVGLSMTGWVRCTSSHTHHLISKPFDTARYHQMKSMFYCSGFSTVAGFAEHDKSLISFLSVCVIKVLLKWPFFFVSCAKTAFALFCWHKPCEMKKVKKNDRHNLALTSGMTLLVSVVTSRFKILLLQHCTAGMMR